MKSLRGITKNLTVHGSPGERRLLPAGLKVALFEASNLPEGSVIKYWAKPLRSDPWPLPIQAWAQSVGVGLSEEDVEVIG